MRLLFVIVLVVVALLLVAFLLLVRPRCTTYEEPMLNRLQTLCADGTRSVCTHNRMLNRVPELSSKKRAR